MISVIIPIFNAKRDLRQMLDGVLAQAYTDYECILIDDGSTDSSYDICKEYAGRDGRFHCFTHGNRGVSYTRNFGILLMIVPGLHKQRQSIACFQGNR